MKIDGKVAVVSLGNPNVVIATARMLIKGGAKVALIGKDAEEGNRVLADLASDYVKFIKADLSVSEEVQNAVAAAVGTFGKIDICLPVGGISRVTGEITDKGSHSLKDFQTIINEQYIGLFELSSLCAVEMMKNEEDDIDAQRGSIVFCISPGYYTEQVGRVGYMAAQGAIETLTNIAASDLLRNGITCMSMRITSYERKNEPEHIASAFKYLIENDYNNGQVLTLDGQR